ELEISEPMGNYGIKVSENNKIFIATGSGLAPFIPMIKSLKEKILLIYGIKNYDEDLSQIFLSEVSNLEVIRCISDENIKITNLNDINSRVTSYLKDNDLDWKNSDFYICGRNEMIVQVSEILENKGVKNIYKENYG
ncbi:hypothetical protein KC669_00930, partial [Candidatus Dojkabacteria bacterium]|nr:hypothetical protein [Candidatus Dojkabacteria bacterium]